MQRRTFLGLLAAAAGLPLKPNTPRVSSIHVRFSHSEQVFRAWYCVEDVARVFNVPPHLLIDDVHVHHSRAVVDRLGGAQQ